MACITLQEYTTASLPKETLSKKLGEILWHNYRDKIDITFPSPATAGMWKLTSKGWVGHIPLSPDFSLSLTPKIPINNLFRMLEYAYRLESFQFIDGLMDCDAINEFYERIANILSLKILERSRRGFYRTYDPAKETLPYLRGRLDIQSSIE